MLCHKGGKSMDESIKEKDEEVRRLAGRKEE
jgi:hypothetical protein